MADTSDGDSAVDNSSAMWNIALLMVSYSCALSSATTVANAAPVAATDVCHASDGVATFTVGMLLLGSAVASPLGASAMDHFGRRPSFLCTCVLTLVFGVGFGVTALYLKSVELLLASCFFFGVGQGMAQFYRFAVVEVCGAYPKAVAISVVISGGVAAGLLGPQGSRATRSAIESQPEFLATFLMMGALCVLNCISVGAVVFPPRRIRECRLREQRQQRGVFEGDEGSIPASAEAEPTAAPQVVTARRTLFSIMTQLNTAVAVAIATLAHTTMLLLMGPIVLAVEDEAHELFGVASNVLMGHFLGMFVPGLVVGVLLNHVGAFIVALFGGLLFAGATVFLLLGVGLWNFAAGMVLLGVAWNMLFSSATLILTRTYEPEDAVRVQGMNDFVIFGVAGMASFVSGYIYQDLGWFAVVQGAAAGVGLELLVLAVLYVYQRGLRQSLARTPRISKHCSRRPGAATSSATVGELEKRLLVADED